MSQSLDELCQTSISGNRHLLVPWYLMASYLYYVKDNSPLSDDVYDGICKRLNDEWDEINHRHKGLVDRAALEAGSGYQLKEDDYPTIVKNAALELIAE